MISVSMSSEARLTRPARRLQWRRLKMLRSAALVLALAVTALGAPGEVAASGRADGSGVPESVPSQRLALHALVLGEAASRVAGQSRLRMVHGSPSIPAVDIYVTSPGAMIVDPAVMPLFREVSFGASTALLSLTPGTYDITITLAGETETAMALPGLCFDAGDVLTVITHDHATDGARANPGLVVIDTNTVRSDGVF
jgi:hypothetical protein